MAKGSKAKGSTTMARDSTAGRGSTATGGTKRVGTMTQGAARRDDDSKGRHEKEGRVDEGRKGMHDGSTEGEMRRRIASTKGGMMTARGDTARGGTARAAQRWAAQRRAARRRAARRRVARRQRGTTRQYGDNKGRHGGRHEKEGHVD